jgi:hypothetical protein
MQQICAVFFDKVVLRMERISICLMVIPLAFMGYKAKDLTRDASAESLLLENDADLLGARTLLPRPWERWNASLVALL